MSEVASAWVTLIPSAKGFAKRTEAEISGDVTKVGQSSGKRMGGGMSAMLGKTLKVGAVGAAVAAGGLVGTALWKGMGRLVALDQAKAKLTGLGHSAASVEKIMGNALTSVKGTAFGLDEAGAVAASAVAAGIKPGRDLTKNLKLVADAATIAGTDMGSMGAIFNKVAASNKVQMDVINQLHDAGVPALSLLADQMGVTAEEASKMASAGEIDFETFQKAMQKGLGGAAQESGKTFSGSVANMQAALGRLGASVLSGVFPKIAPMLTKLTGWLDQAGPYAERFGAALGTAFTWLGQKIPPVVAAVREFFAGLSGGSAQAGRFQGVVSAASTYLTSLRSIFQSTVSIIKSLWATFGPTIVKYVVPFVQGMVTRVAALLQILSGIFRTVAAVLKGDWKGAWDGIKAILKGAMAFMRGTLQAGMALLKGIFTASGIVLRGIARAIWSGVRAAFSAGVSAAVDVAAGLKSKVIGALKGAGSWLVSTGADLVNGLISGIRGMSGAVTSALINLLPGPLRKFADKMGIASPSKVMRDQYGKWIPLGLAAGIDKGAPAVTASMNSLADGVIRSGAVGLGSPRLGEPVSSTGDPSRLASVTSRREKVAIIREAINGVQFTDDRGRSLRLMVQGA